MPKLNEIFNQPLDVVNVGLSSMAQAVKAQGVPVIDVDWRAPVEGVPHLRATKNGIDIDTANEEAGKRIKAPRPTLVGIGPARNVIPGMHNKMILHAGPPVTWERMCGPQRGAVMGALIYEGLAQDEQQAEQIAATGHIEFSPCHHHHTVGEARSQEPGDEKAESRERRTREPEVWSQNSEFRRLIAES